MANAEQDVRMFGHLVEGVVEQDPMTDRYMVRAVDANGKPVSFDIQEALSKLVGQEVRLTLASFKNLEKLSAMAEAAGATDSASPGQSN